jgi:TolA-binding protein
MRSQEAASGHLNRGRELAAEGDYQRALEHYRKVLFHFPDSPPGDEALYRMGLVFAHYANPERDYLKSLEYFRNLAEDFPESSRITEAEMWQEVLEESEEQGAALEQLVVESEEENAAQQQLLPGEDMLMRGAYQGALEHYQGVLSRFPGSPPGDEALFWMGLISAHYANPARDYGKSLEYFQRLAGDFPESSLSAEANAWMGILKEILKEGDARSHYIRGRELATQKKFIKSLKEYQKVHARFPDRPPGDEALFNSGIIYAHYGNPQKDYMKSLNYFKRLVKDFPQSPLAELAHIWIGLLEVIEKSKQADIEIEEKKKELAK